MKIKYIGITATLVIAVMFLSVPKANAEYPNILVGQDLSVGSSNQNVVVLQGLLSEMGYLNIPVGVPMGYYGNLTKNAVASYQANLYVSPTAGYYGSATKVAMHSDLVSHGWLQILNW